MASSTELTDAHALQTLREQLERMREMQTKYSEYFYQLVMLTSIVLVLMATASMTDTLRATVLLIPFYVIWVGAQSAFFLAYILYARVYSTGIEQRINQLLQTDALITHRLEGAFFIPLGSPQFFGVVSRLRQPFISCLILHYWLAGAAAIGLSVYRAWQLYHELMAEFPPVCYYFIALGAWTLLHLIYLIWFFGTHHYERRVRDIVREAYGTNYDKA